MPTCATLITIIIQRLSNVNVFCHFEAREITIIIVINNTWKLLQINLKFISDNLWIHQFKFHYIFFFLKKIISLLFHMNFFFVISYKNFSLTLLSVVHFFYLIFIIFYLIILLFIILYFFFLNSCKKISFFYDRILFFYDRIVFFYDRILFFTRDFYSLREIFIIFYLRFI